MRDPSPEELRERMVREQLEIRGIRNPQVLAAFRKIPRHLFVSAQLRPFAYEDRPLSIGLEQTISQPYMVATMTEALMISGDERVLEVGTGSGYQTAILCELGARVSTIERLAKLSEKAKRRVEGLGYRDVRWHVGDGTLGRPGEGPYDRIIVTAGAPSMPIQLTSQLGEGGILAVPVGDESRQDLYIVRREEGVLKKERICACAFVKLIGKEGW